MWPGVERGGRGEAGEERELLVAAPGSRPPFFGTWGARAHPVPAPSTLAKGKEGFVKEEAVDLKEGDGAVHVADRPSEEEKLLLLRLRRLHTTQLTEKETAQRGGRGLRENSRGLVRSISSSRVDFLNL